MKKRNILKPLNMSKELIIYNSLKLRKTLNSQENIRYHSLQKGYLGEQKLQQILLDFPSLKFISLFNLVYESYGQECQIDSLFISNNTIHLLEIKSFRGNYLYSNQNFYTLPTEKQISNPFMQLERSKIILKQLLERANLHFKLKTHLIFIDNTFVLYGIPINLPIVLPQQLPYFIEKLNSQTNYSEDSLQTAKKLIQITKENSFYEKLPNYDYAKLSKGVFCHKCSQRMKRSNLTHMNCVACDEKESIAKAISRTIEEFALLFPNETLTIPKMSDWTGYIVDRNTMRRILSRTSHYK